MSEAAQGIMSERSRAASLALASAAFALPLLASLVNLLKFDDYPIASREVWPIYAGLVALGGAIALIHLATPRIIRTLIEAAFVALVVDINSDGVLWVVLSATATLVVGLLSRRSLISPMAFGGGLLLLLCVVGVGDSAKRAVRPIASSSSLRPTVLHIILDEHGGIAGLPAENPATPARRETLKAIYLGQGFRVYGAAYSQHMRTTAAVPQILNFGRTLPIREDNRGGGLLLRSSAYFDFLRKQGYALRVYESSWVDLCANDPAVSCVRYDEGGLSGLRKAAIPLGEKSMIILIKMLARSAAVHEAVSLYDRHAVPFARRNGLALDTLSLANISLTSSLQSLEITNKLIEDLAQAKPGQAYVAHVLLPHYPYVLRGDCRVKPRREWLYRHFGGVIREREDAAYEQMLCVARKVQAATAALEHSEAGRNSIVVIHGDHGSRITVHDPRAGAPPAGRDLVAGYATLFAVKAPGVDAGYEPRPARVDDLLAAFARSNFTAAPVPQPARQEIFLEDAKWRPAMRARLPENWAAR
ncbi:hypothetical protein [Phenylobacterium sp.]|uniref:hypothetical protein n=1 Tax=Phenylobacterium sp. TaxID=1871053 RepID=UPI0025DE2E7D|nr:hypothetical protein [Phenylobacterium sp.]MBX3483001.1 hypothetical protein [Phenylobacterium sp.]MCW5759624.1 hypothetical protein [Phenylobacterium sp.]